MSFPRYEIGLDADSVRILEQDRIVARCEPSLLGGAYDACSDLEGDLVTLGSTDGDFALATTGCTINDDPDLSQAQPADPTPGEIPRRTSE